MDIGYDSQGMAASRTYVKKPPEPKEAFILRVPVSLLSKMKAAAQAETKARGVEITVTSMVLDALEEHYEAYEKDYGTLPLVPRRPKTNGKTKPAADVVRAYEKAAKAAADAIAEYAAELAAKLAAEKH